MAKKFDLYPDPISMEPLYPEEPSGKLEALAMELVEKAAKLSGTLNRITTFANADFLRPINSYYSNLIEGHDTDPLDIGRGLKE